MKRRLAAMLLVLAAAAVATAQTTEQTFTVKGTLADSLTKQGEPYATVRIARKAEPEKTEKTIVTDKNGNFKTTVSGSGEMTLTASSMGRKDVMRDFTAAGKKTIDMDTLFIGNADNVLQQVVVTAQKPLVKADIDKIEYSIEDDPDSKSNTVLEMLRKVPMVTVDGEDNIKVNGKSSFKVYVNGKPNKMMTDNPTEVLKSLPANTVKRIEVITNPGPKYDAEGVGGVLNIITTDGGFEGYTVTFTGRAGNTGGGAGTFGTVKQGKLTVSARYYYNHNDNPESRSGGTRLTVGNVTDASSDLLTSYRNKSKYDSHSGSLEASYEIDTLRLVSVELGLWGHNSESKGQGTAQGMAPGTDSELYFGQSAYHNNYSRFSINGGVDYQRTFAGVKDRMFTLSYKISTYPQTSRSNSDYTDTRAADSQWQAFVDKLKAQRTDGRQNSTEHTFQADYTTPIGKAHTVEAGIKYILRNNKSEDDRWQRDLSDNDFKPDTDHSSHYRHRNDIIAAYTGYGLKLGKLSGRLGLRYEHTIQNVEYILGRGSDFSKHFNDLVPSASVGYKLTNMQNVRMGYNMRIYRPGIWYLNPYLDDINPTYITQGNPELVSDKTHTVNLNYSNFTSKVNVNIYLGYSFTNNSIESVMELVSDLTLADKGLQNPTGKDVIYSTYQNIGKMRSLDMSGYANWNVTPSTRINANLYGRYSHMENGRDLRNHGWAMSVNGGVQQTLPKDWRLSINCFYQTPWIMLQGKGTRWLTYSMNISKSFLDKRLTISAFANDFLKKYRKTTWNERSSNFASENYSRMQLMRYGIGVNLRIGELKASVKKAERTISNDDVKSGGGDKS